MQLSHVCGFLDVASTDVPIKLTVFPRINAPAFISYLDSSTRRLYEAGVCTRPALINYL